MISRIITICLLAVATPLAAQYAETEQSLGYVTIGPRDSVLSLDPMSPDSFVIVEPGRLFALKGDMSTVNYSYSDGRPSESHDFFEVRYAGKVTPPDFPPPPISKLPRREDGWLSSTYYIPRAVSYAPLAETMEITYPFFMVESMDGADFYSIYDQKPNGILNDASKKYLDKQRFKLPFENGQERVYFDTLAVVKGDTLVHKFSYLGQYQNLGLYLIEHQLGKKKWLEFVRKSDGATAYQLKNHISTPAFSPTDGWLMAASSSDDKMVFYLQFFQMNLEETNLEEKFTVRIPLQKPTDFCWEDENIVLARIEQTGNISDANNAENFYRIFLTISN